MEREILLSEGAATRLAELEAALVNPIEWYRGRYSGDVWRFILSHPDIDHMSGLRCVLRREHFGATVFWDLPHRKPVGAPEDYKTTDAFMDRARLTRFSVRNFSRPRSPRPLVTARWRRPCVPCTPCSTRSLRRAPAAPCSRR
jgi:hypothetical protein